MSKKSQTIWLTLIMVGATAGLYYGWRQFWFLTDDALIAFRYVSNSLLGLGFVWNPPPFMPVEGYTSYLWVVMLDLIWRLFGAEPPVVANYLSLVFSFLTLGLTAWMAMRLGLGKQLERCRLPLLALVMLGTLSNRSFLAWTSSGLETALFNFCITLWVAVAVMGRRRHTAWLFGLTLSAALVYLTRPDGLLILAATLLILVMWLVSQKPGIVSGGQFLAGLSPLLIPIIHLGWRRMTYGEWLPNTYYAKHVSAWPESGLRYLASFMLEYGLWFWLAVLIWLGWRYGRSPGSIRAVIEDLIASVQRGSGQTPVTPIVVLTILGHIGYYTLIIGGDHFEYRVFSYLIPLVFLSMVWMLNRLVKDGILATVTVGLFILVSWPLPWTHWAVTKDLTTRDDTWIMRIPIAPVFPSGLQWYAEPFDRLQSWLIEHHVCMRHQEHKIFYEFLSARHPERSLQVPPLAGEHPVAAFQSVGVPGWVYPRVAVLDAWGLNDYVVARNPERPRQMRYMAHDRIPPQGYLESFSINYGLLANQSSGFIQREYEITAPEIEATERFWVDRIVHGRVRPFSYAMLNRIGESLYRTGRPDSALGYLQDAIALDSLQSRAYVNLAKCYTRLEQTETAVAHLQTALRLDRDAPLILTRLGRAYAALGYDIFDSDPDEAAVQFTAARTYMTDALKRDSNRAEALVELASINLFLDQVDSSFVYLAALEQLATPPPGELHLLGDRYIFKQRRAEAVRAYRLAIRNGLDVLLTLQLEDEYPELLK